MKKLNFILFGVALLVTRSFAQKMYAKTPHAKTPKTELATFAGGCFWCVVKPFNHYKGVKSVFAGYTGGDLANPTYEQVSSGTTGHYESVQVEFDPKVVSYKELLDGFWRVIDPTDGDGQFADRGSQYKPAIFYHSLEQKKEAEESKKELEKSDRFHGQKIQVAIIPAKPFYKAEEHHQDYYEKNAVHYQQYFEGSGRKRFIEKTWGTK